MKFVLFFVTLTVLNMAQARASYCPKRTMPERLLLHVDGIEEDISLHIDCHFGDILAKVTKFTEDTKTTTTYYNVRASFDPVAKTISAQFSDYEVTAKLAHLYVALVDNLNGEEVAYSTSTVGGYLAAYEKEPTVYKTLFGQRIFMVKDEFTGLAEHLILKNRKPIDVWHVSLNTFGLLYNDDEGTKNILNNDTVNSPEVFQVQNDIMKYLSKLVWKP